MFEMFRTSKTTFFSELLSLGVIGVDCLLDGHGIIVTPCCTLKLESNKLFVLKCFKSSVYSKSRNLNSIYLLNVEFSNNIFC